MSAIRAGMLSIVPLTIIGGLFMIVSELPVAGWQNVVEPYRQLLLVPVTATFGLLSVFVCFAIGYDLGKRLKQEAIISASMATLVFLMLQINIQNDYLIKLGQDDLIKFEQEEREILEEELAIQLDAEDLVTLENKELTKVNDLTLSMKGLGSAGLFTAIIIAIIAVRVQKLFTDTNLVIKLPESVPRVVYESFLSLSPLL